MPTMTTGGKKTGGKATDGKAKVTGKTASAPKVEKGPPPVCLCGCGDRTKGGKFCQGHDAKLKSLMIEQYRDEGALSPRLRDMVKELGWGDYMKKAFALVDAKKKSAKAKDKAK